MNLQGELGRILDKVRDNIEVTIVIIINELYSTSSEVGDTIDCM